MMIEKAYKNYLLSSPAPESRTCSVIQYNNYFVFVKADHLGRGLEIMYGIIEQQP